MKIAAYVFMLLLLVATSAPVCLAEETTEEVSLDALPPSVVSTIPQSGDTDVDPNLTEISVTFSKDMKTTGHCWSWCYVAESGFPALNGDPEYLEDNRTCVLHVKLEPEKTYAIWVNTSEFQSFQDPAGHKAVPYLLVFKTGPGE